MCNLNFKSHNLQTESLFKRAASTYRGSITLSFSSPCYALCLGHFEFKTLLMLSSAFSKRPKIQEIFTFYESSSHHLSGWVPTSSAKVFFQETPTGYRTLAVCQSDYLPQVSWQVEGCGVRERAAVPPAAHSICICTCGWHRHTQGRTSTFQGQASRCLTPQYPYLLPGEQWGIPCTHCRSPLYHQAKGAAQEVQGTPQGCCETVRGVEESSRSRRFSRHHLNKRWCYGPQSGDWADPTDAPRTSEVQSKMIFMGHQISSCHVPVVRYFFILWKMLSSS